MAWVDGLAVAWITICIACLLAAVAFEIRRPPRMAIMRIVWPVTALYFGPVAIWGLLRSAKSPKSFAHEAFDAVTHCGAGCTLGDIIGEISVYAAGWTIGGSMFFASLVVDFCLAFLLGILFQYYTIAPMRGLGVRDGIIAALKADALSLVAFEVGLFGWMALFQFVLFPDVAMLSTLYWFMMQIGMIVGFWTAYPMNVVLLRTGLKEPM